MQPRIHSARRSGVRRAMCAALLAVACGGSPTTPSPASSAPAIADACVPSASGAPGPVADPNGPYYHQVVVARSSDGIHLTDVRQVLDHASVPDGVRRADGSVFIYYVNGETGGVWVARLDGSNATPLGAISLNGIASPAGVVDPDATLLPDGRVRLAYLSGFGPPGTSTARAMCVADSTDGIAFIVVGTALPLPSTDTATDPSLARLSDGTWLMAISRGQQTMLARSATGLAFQAGETLSYGGVPEVTSLPDGRVRLYVCAGGIVSYVSTTQGASWVREGVVVDSGTLGKHIVCDPSWVPGANLFVFKTAS